MAHGMTMMPCASVSAQAVQEGDGRQRRARARLQRAQDPEGNDHRAVRGECFGCWTVTPRSLA